MHFPKRSKIWLPFGLSLTLVSISCGSEDATFEWHGTVVDSAGIRVVHNPEEGLWCPGDGWTFTEGLTIGAEAGDPNLEFGRVTGVELSADGHILVFDQMAGEVRVFDAEGTFLRSMGGRGEGPGEFSQGAAGMFLTRDGRIVIPDPGNQRISWMSLEGDFTGSAAVSYASGFPVRWDGDGRGGVTVQRRAMGFNEDQDLAAGDPLVRINEDGSEEMLVLLPLAKTVWMEGPTPRFRYFETEPSWDMGPGGTLRTAMTQLYSIELRGADGALQSIITKPSPARPVTDGDKARFEVLMRDALERMGLTPASIDRQINNLDFGTTFPAFNQIMEGPEGTTLVQRIDPLEEIEALDLAEEMSRRLGSNTWEVFGADGRFWGTFDLPDRFTPMVWRPTAVYGRWLDDLDRPYMKKLNLEMHVRTLDGRCN